MTTLEPYLDAVRNRANAAREAGNPKQAAALEACADELAAALKAYEAAAATRLSIFEQAEDADNKLRRFSQELHEHAADYASGPALAATLRLNRALTQCRRLMEGP